MVILFRKIEITVLLSHEQDAVHVQSLKFASLMQKVIKNVPPSFIIGHKSKIFRFSFESVG